MHTMFKIMLRLWRTAEQPSRTGQSNKQRVPEAKQQGSAKAVETSSSGDKNSSGPNQLITLTPSEEKYY